MRRTDLNGSGSHTGIYRIRWFAQLPASGQDSSANETDRQDGYSHMHFSDIARRLKL